MLSVEREAMARRVYIMHLEDMYTQSVKRIA